VPETPVAAFPTSTRVTPEQRQEDALARYTVVADDREAVEQLLREVTGSLLSAERLIVHLKGSRRLAQRGRDTTKASMVATNANLLKVRIAPCTRAPPPHPHRTPLC
jgi:hypothetical protein